MVTPAHPDKATMVEAMFDRIAHGYDRMNDLMTFGLHRAWKHTTLAVLGCQRGGPILDVATGTGDLAIALAARLPAARIVGLDFSAEMLTQARQRGAGQENLSLVRGDALALPFAERTFSAATSGFALRNVADLSAMFAEIARVLTPGAPVALLDLVPVTAPRPWTRLAQWYLSRVVPHVGTFLVRDAAAYAYLPASVESIPPAPAIAHLLREAGFSDVHYRFFGFGTVALILGWRQ